MKINKLIPILSTTAIVGVITPLVTSCGASWTGDENWKPSIQQYQIGERLDNDTATNIYFPEAMKNKKIIFEDFCWNAIGLLEKTKQHYINKGFGDVDGSVKVKANKINVERIKHTRGSIEEEFFLLSGEFEFQQIITYTDDNDPEHPGEVVTCKETHTNKTVWDRVNAKIEHSGNYWIVGCFRFVSNPEWKWYSSLDDVMSIEKSWPNSGSPMTEKNIDECHSIRTSEETEIPLPFTFSSYFFNNVKGVLRAEIECAIPEAIQTTTHTPILVNTSVTEGQIYESDVIFQLVDGYDFDVSAIRVDGEELTKGTDWEYIAPSNDDETGHVKIKNVSKVIGNIIVSSKYTKHI